MISLYDTLKAEKTGAAGDSFTSLLGKRLAYVPAPTWHPVALEWKRGGIYTNGQTIPTGDEDTTNRARTYSPGFIDMNGKRKIVIASGYKYRLAYYAEKNEPSFIEFSDWLTEDTEVTNTGRYAKLLCGYTDNRNITADMLPTIAEDIQLYSFY